MKQLQFPDYAALALERLGKGAFLTSAHGSALNTMTISWGNLGIMWAKPICTVMVRPSRHTYGILEHSREFTLSLPLDDSLTQALALCGTKSGRDMNKFATANLTVINSQKLTTPVISGHCLHLECKVVYRQAMDADGLLPDIQQSKYAEGDYHVFYGAEIVAAYVTE